MTDWVTDTRHVNQLKNLTGLHYTAVNSYVWHLYAICAANGLLPLDSVQHLPGWMPP
jgi:hypothetical protein